MEGADPYAPAYPANPARRPLTPFMIFAGEIRSVVLQEDGRGMNDVEKGREIVRRWTVLRKEVGQGPSSETYIPSAQMRKCECKCTIEQMQMHK